MEYRTTWRELKDLVMIYHEREWDDAKVMVWDPIRQEEYNLVFCGSSRPDDGVLGEINFNIIPIKEYDEAKELTTNEKKSYYLRVMAAHIDNPEVYKWAKEKWLEYENV